MAHTMYPPRQLSYAPTPYSYTPTSSLSATINLDEVGTVHGQKGAVADGFQEVKLAATNAERDLYDSLAEIYSIITTLDAVERAYLKDSIPEAEYTETCSRLLKQYKSNLADEVVAKAFGDLETFKREWHVSEREMRRLR